MEKAEIENTQATNYNKQAVYNLLKEHNIPFQVTEHPPVFTMEEMRNAGIPHTERIPVNLFLRDDKKRNYYLLTIHGDRKINLKEFRQQFHTRALSFASENDLQSILGLKKGAVTPFGLLNDQEHKVHFFIDQALTDGIIGIHPNDNTATVWIKTSDLLSLITHHGNELSVIP